MGYRTAILILSDRAAAGTRADACAPVVAEVLGDGFEVEQTQVLPDDAAALQARLIELSDARRLQLIVTSGGTGVAPRDRTPQATAAVLDYEIPGIGEAMRAASLPNVPTAMLSRALAGVRGATLIVALPGSPKAVREMLAVLRPVLPHALDLLSGGVADG